MQLLPTGERAADAHVPHPRSADGLDDVEQQAASLADLVLKVTALADRYDRTGSTQELVHRLRAAAERGRCGLQDLLVEQP